MENIKIIASDLDGTLLSHGGALSEENLRAIDALAVKGIKLIPVTGRCFAEIPKALREHPDIRYYVCSGGSVIYDKLTDTSEVVGISKEKTDYILSVFARTFYWPVFHYRNNAHLDRKKYEMMVPSLSASGNYTDGILAVWSKGLLDDFEAFFKGRDNVEMICAVFADKKDQLAAAEAIKNEFPDVVISLDTFTAFNNLEVVASGADKGTAIGRLLDRLGVGKDSVIAIGDSQNDIRMLERFKNSLAVANAKDEVKRVASRVICKNTEHALDYVLKLILK